MILLAHDTETAIAEHPEGSEACFIRTDQLAEATGFELKPQGACFGELCFPLSAEERAAWIDARDDGEWLDYRKLADKVGQPCVRDGSVWSLGTVPEARRSTLEAGVAPDFEIDDRDGNTIRLSDFRGKKVLIVTWASW